MAFVLYVTEPAEGDSEGGREVVSEPHSDRDGLFKIAYWSLRKRAPWMHPDVANQYAEQIVSKDIGAEWVEAGTGLRFRIDKVEGGQGEP